MRHGNYVPNEKIIDRVVKIWKEMLKDPVYDNGDNSTQGGMASMLAEMLPKNSTDENLEEFGKHLKKGLMVGDERGYLPRSLNVDYHPDKALADAAAAAGLKTQFPWKTNVYFSEDHLSVSAGYGARSIYHYPLENGKWLVTDMTPGEDLEKIKKFVVDGTLPVFKVVE